MRKVIIAIVTASAALWITKVSAVPLLDCKSVNTAYGTVCNEQELRKLGSEIDDELSRLLRSADPLTALLLKCDQVFFAEILAADDSNLPSSPSEYDKNYARILALLKTRRHVLTQLRNGGATTLEGNWNNVFANVTITKAEAGAITLAIEARLSYPSDSRGEVDCSALVTATQGKNGWYSASIGDKDDRGRLDIIRFRLQGNTLRIANEVNGEAGVCDGKPHIHSDRRGGADVLTGSYFPTGPVAKAAGASVLAVAPSFDCAKAENADEEEICADPELALADIEVAQLYRKTIGRLDRALAGYLRADQRSWVSGNSKNYLYNLHPGSDKEQYDVHHSSSARHQLSIRQKQLIFLLANLDEKRQGVEGFWIGHNAALAIFLAKSKGDGTMHADGAKWDVEDYKARCDFASDGRIENGVFKSNETFPTIKRDGSTLVVAPEDPDKHEEIFDKNGREKKQQPDYCNRMRSPKARLFPVKPDIGIDAHDWHGCYLWLMDCPL